MGSLGEALAEAQRIAWEDPSPDWFAPARTSIEDLDAATAASSPSPGLNASWRVLHHLRTGYLLWARWLAGEPADPGAYGADEEWTPIDDPSAAAWEALRIEAVAAEAAFRAVTAGLPDEMVRATDPRFGESRLAVILSVVAHTAYHAGELRTLATIAGGAAASGPSQ